MLIHSFILCWSLLFSLWLVCGLSSCCFSLLDPLLLECHSLSYDLLVEWLSIDLLQIWQKLIQKDEDLLFEVISFLFGNWVSAHAQALKAL